MAKKTVLVSDLSGAEINGKSARVRIDIDSKPGMTFVLEAGEDEVAELVSKARAQNRRGRKATKAGK
jgi:hypothetical protein